MVKRLRDSRERGATGIEYGLIAALIAVVVITTVTALGGTLSSVFGGITSVVSGMGAGGGDEGTDDPPVVVGSACTYAVSGGSYDSSRTALMNWTSTGSCPGGIETVSGAARVRCVNGETFSAFQEAQAGRFHVGDNYQCNGRGGVAAFYSDGASAADIGWNAWELARPAASPELFAAGPAAGGSGATCTYSITGGGCESSQTGIL